MLIGQGILYPSNCPVLSKASQEIFGCDLATVIMVIAGQEKSGRDLATGIMVTAGQEMSGWVLANRDNGVRK